MSKLRSTIDWNELVPRLPKGLRDTLFLEAVTMLSGEAPETAPIQDLTTRGKPRQRARRIPDNTLLRGLRTWSHDGPGNGHLTHPGRVFKIIRTVKGQPRFGLTGAVWAKIVAVKGDLISYPGLTKLCKEAGVKSNKYSAVVGGLWARRFLEITEQPGEKAAARKVGEAY
jgi:hypothetical protein